MIQTKERETHMGRRERGREKRRRQRDSEKRETEREREERDLERQRKRETERERDSIIFNILTRYRYTKSGELELALGFFHHRTHVF